MAEVASHLRYVPYDSPYDHQREAMGRIGRAIDRGDDVLFEGACGTGKTLAALAPALEHARTADRTVVITTNVHQQMRQFVEEASAIADEVDLRAVVFRGKDSMCHIDVDYKTCQSLRDTTRDLIDTEREATRLKGAQEPATTGQAEDPEEGDGTTAASAPDRDAVAERLETLQDSPTCDRYYNNRTTGTAAFFEWLYENVRSPDEIYDFAHERGLCGYELLKEGVDGVDLVICNYRHLLDPGVREQFLRWLGREASDVVGVFDEAHNLPDAARSHARRTLTEATLSGALTECAETDDPRAAAAANVLSSLEGALESTVDAAFAFGERERVGTAWHDLAIDNEGRRDDLTLALLEEYTGPGIHEEVATAIELGAALDDRYDAAYRRGDADGRRESQIHVAARFLEEWLAESAAVGRYPLASVRRPEESERLQRRLELATCIPERITGDLFDALHASVLMSATLRPFDVTTDVLGLDAPATLAYGQQFPPERRRTFAVDGPALFARNREEPAVQETVTGVLADAVRFTPGNTLVFCPSYAEAERYHDRLAVGTGYLDRPGTRAEELRAAFTAGDDGVLFTSLWGTLSEGVSYDGDDARTVVVVGVPYPELDDRMGAIQRAYDATFETDGRETAGWRYAVDIPTVRKTRQALGRVVRSPRDYGARLLLDGRYTERAAIREPQYAVRERFPPEERAELVDIEPEKVRYALLNFYADLDAYDGAPPTPE